MNGHSEPAGGQPLLTREILTLAGSLGTALLAVTLTCAMTARLPGFGGSISGAAARAAANPARALPALASAFGATFWVALALTAAAVVPALALPGRRSARQQQQTAPQARHHPEPTGAPGISTRQARPV